MPGPLQYNDPMPRPANLVVCALLLAAAAGLCSAPTQQLPIPPDLLKIVELQTALVRDGISPGPIDGISGGQTEIALKAFQQKHGLRATGVIDESTRVKLPIVAPLFVTYIVTSNDLARLLPLPPTWLGKSLAPRLDYESLLELVAEK